MVAQGTQPDLIITALLEALRVESRRRGAEDTLIKAGASAVSGVGALITDDDSSVARSAKHILSKIGVPALPLVWIAFADKSNTERRDAALDIFLAMPTHVVRDELVLLLKSDTSEDIAMAVALLLERVRDEKVRSYADDKMVPELLNTLLTSTPDASDQRLLALLLLLGEQDVLDDLLQALDTSPQYRKQLVYLLLQFSPATHRDLLQVLSDTSTSPSLRADLVGILGMLSAPNEVITYAESLSRFGISSTHESALDSTQLALAQHALGGLLAGGQWDEQRLKDLRATSKEGSVTHELSSVLLGWRYEPQLAQLQAKLEMEQAEHRNDVLTFTQKVVENQERISELETDLEQVRAEHGRRGNELQDVKKEREQLKKSAEQTKLELEKFKRDAEQAKRENDSLRKSTEQTKREHESLTKELHGLREQIRRISVPNKP
jgi:hypothetical protein